MRHGADHIHRILNELRGFGRGAKIKVLKRTLGHANDLYGVYQ
jgi:hypothetical protein